MSAAILRDWNLWRIYDCRGDVSRGQIFVGFYGKSREESLYCFVFLYVFVNCVIYVEKH